MFLDLKDTDEEGVKVQFVVTSVQTEFTESLPFRKGNKAVPKGNSLSAGFIATKVES
jgi:hypothetical protein